MAIFWALAALPMPLFAQFDRLVPATVAAVYDGDGFRAIFQDGRTEPVRFVGVDAPEKRGYSLKAQPYGNIAGDSLRAWCKGKAVLLDTLATKESRDVWGRLLAEPYFADTSSICLRIVEAGLAWKVAAKGRAHPKMSGILERAMKEARSANRGLWASYLTAEGKKARVYTPETWRRMYSIR